MSIYLHFDTSGFRNSVMAGVQGIYFFNFFFSFKVHDLFVPEDLGLTALSGIFIVFFSMAAC